MGGNLSSLIEESRIAGGEELCITKGRIKEKDDALQTISEELPMLNILEVRNLKLKKISNELNILKELQVLVLDNNKLSTIPSSISSLCLNELRVTHNKLMIVPPIIVKCVNIEILDFGYNEISELPDLLPLRQLQTLILQSNQLTEFPVTITNIPSLTKLDISDNQIEIIPDDINNLISLEYFNIRRNSISILPSNISHCIKLKELDISENKIIMIPTELTKMIEITSFSAQHNKISALPDDFGNLSKIRTLKLHDNHLCSIPCSIGKLEHLAELFIQENKIDTLPSEIGQCKGLRKLYAEYNIITKLPEEINQLTNLIVLILHHNQLTELPESLKELKQLLRFSLDDNPLDEKTKKIISTSGALSLLKDKEEPIIQFASAASRATLNSRSFSRPTLHSKNSPSWQKEAEAAFLRLKSASTPTNSLSEGRQHGLKRNTSLMLTPKERQVGVPEEEMKRFMENRRGSAPDGGGSMIQPNSRTMHTGGGSMIQPNTRVRAMHSQSISYGYSIPTVKSLPEGTSGENTNQLVGVAGAMFQKREQAKPVPSYSKFKYTFENFVESSDFSSERKKDMQKMTPGNKWKLLNQYKGSTLDIIAESNKAKINAKNKKVAGPVEFVGVLCDRPTLKNLDDVVLNLETQGSTWTANFVEAGGISALVEILKSACTKRRKSRRDNNFISRGLKCIHSILEVSLRTVLTTTDSVNSIVMCLHSDIVDIQEILMAVLSFIVDIHYVGPQMVTEALDNYNTVLAESDPTACIKRLIAPLTRIDVGTDILINALFVINTLISEETDLEKRLVLRKRFVREGIIGIIEGLRELAGEVLLTQLEKFEEDLDNDYEETLLKFEKEKVLEKMAYMGGENDEIIKGDYLSVLIAITGKQMSVPIEETTIVKAVIGVISTQRQAMKEGTTIEDYGLLHKGVWLPEDQTFASLSLTGKGAIVSEYKMKPFEIRVVHAPLGALPLITTTSEVSSTSEEPDWSSESSGIEAGGGGGFDSSSPFAGIKHHDERTHMLHSPSKERLGGGGGAAASSSATSSKKLIVNAKTVLLDPNLGVSDALTTVLEAFELDNTDTTEDYGLFLVTTRDKRENTKKENRKENGKRDGKEKIEETTRDGNNKELKKSDGVWLDDTQKLINYAPFLPTDFLRLQKKPVALTVCFYGSEAKGEFLFPPYETVGNALNTILDSMLYQRTTTTTTTATKTNSNDEYGLFVKRMKKKNLWLGRSKRLSEYNFNEITRIWVQRKPKRVYVSFQRENGERGRERSMKVDLRCRGKELQKLICKKLRRSSSSSGKYSLYHAISTLPAASTPKAGERERSSSKRKGNREERKSARGSSKKKNKANNNDSTERLILLNPATSLWEQNVRVYARLVLGPFKPFEEEGNNQTSPNVNIWEEGDGEDFITFDNESLPLTSTLNKVVEYITPPKEEGGEGEDNSLDENNISTFAEAFLMGYRTFVSPEKLLSKFGERLDVPDSSSLSNKEAAIVKLRVCMRIEEWIKLNYKELISSSVDFSFLLEAFVRKAQDAGVRDPAGKILEAIKHPPEPVSKQSVPNSTGSLKKLPKCNAKIKNFGDEVTVFDIDETELARQLTLRSFFIYSKIESHEFFGSAWNKSDKKAPHIISMINDFNKVSSWVATCIVSTPKLRERKKLVEKLVKIAQALRMMNNFHLVMAFVSGINNSAVLRLKWTRHKLSKRVKATMSELESLMSLDGAFSTYRKKLKKATPPCLPYIGVYLTDLTFIEEGNPDRVNGLLNVSKTIMIHNIVHTVRKYQTTPYNFQSIDVLQKWVKDVKRLSDEQLYELSLQCEPRGAKLGEIN